MKSYEDSLAQKDREIQSLQQQLLNSQEELSGYQKESNDGIEERSKLGYWLTFTKK